MAKYHSQGCALQISIASVFTTIGQVQSIDGPDGEVQFFDGTALDSGVSVEDGELTGMSTPGSVSITLLYDPSNSTHNALARKVEVGGVNDSWKEILPDSEEITFSGSVAQFKPKAGAKDPFTADMRVKLRSVAAFPAA